MKLKITANVEPFNHQITPDSEPVLITKDKVIEAPDDDLFFQRYIALGWAEKVEEGEEESPAKQEKNERQINQPETEDQEDLE